MQRAGGVQREEREQLLIDRLDAGLLRQQLNSAMIPTTRSFRWSGMDTIALASVPSWSASTPIPSSSASPPSGRRA